ncbi:molybdopterin molybdotransferase MoeA [Aquibium oceanicum]|uniref:Molybdopterin molybdenumtransferase n=1 Tax=Aquibium oceanicum TaxID=1670800 RepID=A0A1L3SSC2_9HYPH|nr:gephyrin-like molybdotransferase Glp [Aquibium oceanicum]APH72319.1 molybdopterin molybdenumtransferase MoeA [Aquibium oceanicum]
MQARTSALLPVDEALRLLLDGVEPLAAERLPIADCGDRILAADIVSLRTQPPFDASAMDGYAVRSADVSRLPARLKVIGAAPAGRPFAGTVGPGQAVRIFTGAPMPEGSDCVLIQEDATTIADNVIEAKETVSARRHVRARGLDFTEGQPLLNRGRRLDPPALSLAASANHAALDVVRKPLVAVIATGDELLPPGSIVGPGQIIASNGFGVAEIVRSAGARVLDCGIVADDRDAISATLDRALEAGANLIVTIGGASVGVHDLVREVLTARGGELDFWKIAMRPGKPLMAGTLGGRKIVGLPGNPVASLVCSYVFLKPLVARMAGRLHEADLRTGVLGAPVSANDQRQDYLRAAIRREDGRIVATPSMIQDSSMLRVMAEAGAFIVRAPFAPPAEAGEECRLLVLS